MQEQRKTDMEPSRKPESLGEGLVLDAVEKQTRGPRYSTRAEALDWLRRHPQYTIFIEAEMIDTRFAPLIEAAEAVCGPMDRCGLSAAVDTLRAAIAKAKGGAK